MVLGADSVVKITARLFLTYSGEKPVNNVTIIVSCPSNIHVVPKNVLLQRVSGLRATPVVVKITFYATKKVLATGLECVITASYTTSKGEPNVAAHYLTLPLYLCCRPKAPSKSAACKIVLDTEFPAVPLTELFSDVLYAYQEAGLDVGDVLGNNAVQAMGFQFFAENAGLVSILVSKNAGRYRVQAESYPALYLLLNELEKRLSSRLMEHPNANLSIMSPTSKVKPDEGLHGANLVKCAENLPIDEFFGYINEHLQVRRREKKLT